MKKIANIFVILLSFLVLQNCEEDQFSSSLQYVSFSAAKYSTGVPVDGNATIDVTVYTSKVVSSDVVFNISVDATSNAAAGSYTVPSSVTVLSGTNKGTMTVAVSDVDLGIGINKLILNFDSVTEGYANGASTSVEYIQNCTEVTATLNIVFDGYGSETGWNIKDALGGVVASKAAKTYADGQATANETIKLCAGRNYTFTITDSFKDGLSYPTDGSYTLKLGTVVKATGGGDFGASQATPFNTK